MKRRTFISTAMLSGAYSLFQNNRLLSSIKPTTQSQEQSTMPFTLPNLPYATDALEPHIDKMTMEIHHGKHHAAYVTNLNKAIEGTEWDKKSIEQILAGVSKLPVAVRNNGGGDYKYIFFLNLREAKGGGGPRSGRAAATPRGVRTGVQS